MSDDNTTPLKEIEAMTTVANALTLLDENACGRVLRWAADRFGVEVKTVRQQGAKDDVEGERVNDDSQKAAQQFGEIADLYTATTPGNDSEKALIIGYWFQVIQEQKDFDAGRVNKELQQLGHGVSNITTAMNGLIGRKPALAMQTKKSGNSQQARKKYKLTHEGIQKVKEMINH
jgi:hypothetical protein